MNETTEVRIRKIQDSIARTKVLKEQNKKILEECKQSLFLILNSNNSFVEIVKSIDNELVDINYLDKIDSMNYEEAMILKGKLDRVVCKILDSVEGSLQ